MTPHTGPRSPPLSALCLPFQLMVTEAIPAGPQPDGSEPGSSGVLGGGAGLPLPLPPPVGLTGYEGSVLTGAHS